MSTPLLSVKNLTTQLLIQGRPYPVVDNLSFDLRKGETLAIVGESGCGKSMAALSILRILPTPPALPSEGEILFEGVNLLTLTEKKMREIRGSKISMISQNPMGALNPVYTIGEQYLEVARFHLGLDEKKAVEWSLKTMEDVHLPNPKSLMKEYPHMLSGGMLQRAVIGMSLICEPNLLIADEPTTALDVTIQSQILNLLKELQEKKGMALLLITHDMGIVAEMAQNVVVMYASHKVEESASLPLFTRPAHPYSQGLFQSRPDRPLKKGLLPTIKGSVPPPNAFPSGCHFHPRCPYAMPICKEGEVPFFTTPSNQEVKCWLYDKNLKEKLG